ncbi:MAG: response regulator [Planctomycetes bacterium]|nr:response regulator [Planctomycetota bacterium]
MTTNRFRSSGSGAVSDLTPVEVERVSERVESHRGTVAPSRRLLVVAANQILPTLMVPLMQGTGMSDFAVELPTDMQVAAHWLATRTFDAYLFEESSLALLDGLPSAARARIERRSIVVTLLESAHRSAMTCASCIPLSRLTRFSLEHSLGQVIRRHPPAPAVTAERSEVYDVLLRLARLDLGSHQDLERSLRPLTEAAAETLGVGRTSVWMLREDPKRLVCLDLFDQAAGTHANGIEVPADACPAYCIALSDHRILSIADALHDERTRELVPIYLRDAGIGALLDAPIYLDGRVAGLFCHAHLGAARRWTADEERLGATFADYAQLVLVAHQQRTAQHALAARDLELAQAQKMEALGRLASGVAHDFNNLLTVISGRMQMLVRTATRDQANDTDPIMTACERARDLVQQLMSFARKGSDSATWVNVDTVVTEVANMLERTIGPAIEVVCSLQAKSAVIYGDAGEIQRALLNLGINARDAMPDGGRLVFSTRNTCLEAGAAHRLRVGVRSEFVEISVTDTGTGMSDEVKRQVLEPFFTTKEAGKGTGLGLACVNTCARNHSGHLEFTSDVGLGTSFRLFLPLSAGAAQAGQSRSRTAIAPAGIGSIVVVDDDDQVRATVARMLVFLGYRVHACSDGWQAIDHVGKHRDEIDLVLLDLVMPELGGRDCMRALRLIRSTIPILIMTGSVPEQALEDCRSVVAIVRKPFVMSELAQAVAAAMSPRS